MKRVLITGATGALGRALVDKIRKNGDYQVTQMSRHFTSVNSFEIKCDIKNPKELNSTIEYVRPDIIFHLAASFTDDLNEAYLVNVLPAQQILDLIQSTRLGTKLILVGSAAEYGVVQPDENPIGENRVLKPVSVYGVTKAWQTSLTSLYSNKGVNVCCARIFNLYGPGISEKLFAGRLQKQIANVLSGKSISIEVGPLSAIRDYISTEQAATQLLVIARHGTAGETYNVATGSPISIRDFLLYQLKDFEIDSSLVQESKMASNREGYDVPAIYADMTKTKNLFKAANLVFDST